MKKLLFLCLTFNIFAVPLHATSVVDKIIVNVNNQPITEQEVTNAMQQAKEELQATNSPIPNQQELREQVLKNLITESLVLQIAKQNNYEASDEEVNRVIDNIAVQNKVDILQFRALLAQQGLDFDEYRSKLKDKITMSNIQMSAINDDLVISNQELEEYLAKHRESQKEYRLSSILIKVTPSSTPSDIRKAENKALNLMQKLQNGESFESLAASTSDAPNALNSGDLGWVNPKNLPPEMVKAIETLKVGEVLPPMSTPGGIMILKLAGFREVYEKQKAVEYNVRQILLKKTQFVTEDDLKQKLLELRKEAQKNNNFSELAQMYSEDISSSNKGGKLGWVGEHEVVPDFFAALKNAQLNKISDPFVTQLGWHLIIVDEKRDIDASLRLKKEEAMIALKSQKSKDAVQLWINKLMDSAYIEYLS